MSLHCDWVSACQTAIVDRVSGRMTLVHVVDAVAAPRFPAQVGPLHVVASWHNGGEAALAVRLRVAIEAGDGETHSVLAEEDVALSGRSNHRTICIIQSLTVLRPGPYRVIASWQDNGQSTWQQAAQHTFQVQTAPALAGTAQA
jgi:hypothetical protein